MTNLLRFRTPLVAILSALVVSCAADDTSEEVPDGSDEDATSDASDATRPDTRADVSDAADAPKDTVDGATADTADAKDGADAPIDTADTAIVDTADGATSDTLDGATPDTLDGATPDTLDGATPDTLDAATPDTLDGATPDTLDAAPADTLDGAVTDVGCLGDGDCSGVAHGFCQTVSCEVSTGTCLVLPKSDTTSCDDGNACTTVDHCSSGSCLGTAPITCSASDQCHDVGACNPSTGTCSNPAKGDGTGCNDGSLCTTGETCTAGACGGGTTTTCSASDQCHTAGVCDPSSGACSNPAKGDGAACNDGSLCTTGETCTGGACGGGTTTTCSASDQCHDVGTCDPGTGACSNPAKGDGTTCNDGSLCTSGETCTGGICGGGSSVTCSASDQCHDAGTCNPSTGLCSNPAKGDGATCNDGDLCTTGETCTGGACGGGTGTTCTAGDECHTAGTCNPSTGACSNPAAADGTVCTTGGTNCLVAKCEPQEFLVVRVGDGAAALSNASTATFIERHKFDGTLVTTIALDTTGSTTFTLAGSSGTEGTLSRAADGSYVMIAGYNVATGQTSVGSQSTSTAPIVLRAVGRINPTNTFDFGDLPSTAFSGQSIRAATSSDGSATWAAGANGSGNGTRYWVRGASTEASVTTTNMRAVNIFGGQLFGSSGSSGLEVFTIGTGLPTSSSTPTLLPGLPAATAAGPHGFIMFDLNANNFMSTGMDTLYVADDRTVATGGGIQKWTYSDATSTWSLVANYNTGGTTGMLSVTGLKTAASTVKIIATSNESTTKVYSFTDDGVTSPVVALIPGMTAGTNTAYRGVAMVPK